MLKLFGARWWEVVGAIVAIVGVSVTLYTVFFSGPDPVLIEDPKYPEIRHNSRCQGEWVYEEFLLCEDKSVPIFEVITSAEICGVSHTSEMRQVVEFAECEHPSHGIKGYRESRTFEDWSGWKQGGYNRQAWCNDLQNRAQSEIGEPIQWEVVAHDERSKEEFLRRFFYKYYCRAVARWNPIYVRKRSSACGPAQPQPVSVEVPNTCPNKEKTIGYEASRRRDCGTSGFRQYVGTEKLPDLITRLKIGEISWCKCATCDDLRNSPVDYAECLIASAFYYMDSSNPDGMKLIRSKLVALSSNPLGLSSRIKSRIDDQIEHLKEAL